MKLKFWYGIYILLLAVIAISIVGIITTPAGSNQPEKAISVPVQAYQAVPLKQPATESPKPKSEPQKKIYNENEEVKVGYTSYVVTRSFWTSRLDNNPYGNPPDALYLVMVVLVVNNDKKPRTIPPFKLIDEDGAEYETSPNGFAVDHWIGPLVSLNPKVQKSGFIVFDIPPEHQYKLEVSGGFWSEERALIQLSPKNVPKMVNY